jgi:hypothetical protein
MERHAYEIHAFEMSVYEMHAYPLHGQHRPALAEFAFPGNHT